jgi:taurine dioxygenase
MKSAQQSAQSLPGVIEIKPFAAALGAEIVCGDVRRLDQQQSRAIKQAWLDHLVLLFRAQTLNDDELVAFAQRFGKLSHPVAGHQLHGNVEAFRHPHVNVVSNVIENGVPIGSLGDGEAYWHTDFSFEEVPYAATMLYSLEIPPDRSGNTGFTNMYLAYETLPRELRERIRGLSTKQDASYNSAGMLRRGYQPVTDVRVSPGPIHPLVRTHTETGRNCLYLGRRNFAYIVGMEVAESERLLDALWAHTDQPRFQWHHQWQVGDVLVWDNRCTMHHRDAFDPKARRVMHKTMTEGDRPHFLPTADDSAKHPRGYLDAASA